MKNNNNFRTITFYNLAISIGAVKFNKTENRDKNININNLILDSFLFLIKNTILTKKDKQEYEVFKDSYNRYIDYCIENNIVTKDSVNKIKSLNITTVPDMSKIKVPDITKELDEMNIDLSKIGNLFGSLSKK
ncbi:MAG: hypothetical protein U9N59_13170 [Campylobacterota bacterium]|nr:hypothetical protein [Campylobacterota bacterium]